MESDIIIEGFRLSEQMQGVRYMCVIGDGDSSVMANIHQYITYGPYVEKIECANHACKCYRNCLEESVKDHPEFRGRGGLTKRAIQRMTTGARIAIKMHSKTGDVEQLRKDLRNGPPHVFGEHTKCNTYCFVSCMFCFACCLMGQRWPATLWCGTKIIIIIIIIYTGSEKVRQHSESKKG